MTTGRPSGGRYKVAAASSVPAESRGEALSESRPAPCANGAIIAPDEPIVAGIVDAARASTIRDIGAADSGAALGLAATVEDHDTGPRSAELTGPIAPIPPGPPDSAALTGPPAAGVAVIHEPAAASAAPDASKPAPALANCPIND